MMRRAPMSMFRVGRVRVRPRGMVQSSYYAAAMAAFGVTTTRFNSTATGVSFQRDAASSEGEWDTVAGRVVCHVASLAPITAAVLSVDNHGDLRQVVYLARIPTQ